MSEALFRLTDDGGKPGKVRTLELLIDGEWQDISGALEAGIGAEYRLRWSDHRWLMFYKQAPDVPLVTHYDKDGKIIEL